MTQLIGIPYSPWSEKARWALEARGVPYQRVTYAPLLGELGLRKRMGKWTGRISVPVLFDDAGKAVEDSSAIARWADGRGEGLSLFPAELDAEVTRYVALSEKGLDAGRCISLHRMLADHDALLEMVPRSLRALPLAASIADLGIRRTLRKYEAGRTTLEAHTSTLTAVLDELRAALAAAPAVASEAPKTLLGRFTFADIAMSQVLGFVDPPSFGIRVGKASRRTFTDVELGKRYGDLVTWRNALYDAYRPRDPA